MDPIKILQRAWYILWNYRTLWVFGLILALATASSTGRGGNNGVQYQVDGQGQPPPQNMQEFFREVGHEMEKLFREGIPEMDISGEALTAFLWILGGFLVVMLLVGIGVAIARYVSETAVIRMVDEYEGSGAKMTLRQGFRTGWSRSAWRLFLINLIASLPMILLLLLLIGVGIGFYVAVVNGNAHFGTGSVVAAVGLVFLAIFIAVILTIVLSLLRQFFWRVCVLENVGVEEALRRGFAMVRDHWKSVGLMWLVMIGLGIAWIVVSIVAALITLPLVIVTSVLAAVVVAVPGLLLVGLFSPFLSGPILWIAAGIFVLPLFLLIAFSPWLLLGSWQSVFTSTVWTLTYREIKALPASAPPVQFQPAGD